MGRRSRKKVVEHKKIEEIDEEEPEQELTQYELEYLKYERFDFIYNLREKIMQAREDLPLCEYLDVDSFFDFVNDLTMGE